MITRERKAREAAERQLAQERAQAAQDRAQAAQDRAQATQQAAQERAQAAQQAAQERAQADKERRQLLELIEKLTERLGHDRHPSATSDTQTRPARRQTRTSHEAGSNN